MLVDCFVAALMPPRRLLWHPDLASSLLTYRYIRIAGAEVCGRARTVFWSCGRTRVHRAQEKAGSYSPPYSGAMFPWESAFTGEECCPTWAVRCRGPALARVHRAFVCYCVYL